MAKTKKRKDLLTYRLPAYYASYLINGDASGLEPEDWKRIDEWLYHRQVRVITVQEDEHGNSEPFFTHGHDMNRSQGADVLDFICEEIKPRYWAILLGESYYVGRFDSDSDCFSMEEDIRFAYKHGSHYEAKKAAAKWRESPHQFGKVEIVPIPHFFDAYRDWAIHNSN